MPGVWTVIVAAGSGERFGRAKQFELLGDRRVLDWSLDAARAVSDGVVLVLPADSTGRREPGVDAVVAGGPTRSSSVRAGLAAVPGETEVVVIHDAVRPLASVRLFERVVAAIEAGADGAIPALPVTSTIKRVTDGAVTATVERDGLFEVQTPQAFAALTLRKAHADEPEATDDAALIEGIGGKVVVVEGEATNMKITHAHDLTVARALLESR